MTNPQVPRAAATATRVLELAVLVLEVRQADHGTMAAAMAVVDMKAMQIDPTGVMAKAPVAKIGLNKNDLS